MILSRSLEPCPGAVCLGLALELAQGRALPRETAAAAGFLFLAGQRETLLPAVGLPCCPRSGMRALGGPNPCAWRSPLSISIAGYCCPGSILIKPTNKNVY